MRQVNTNWDLVYKVCAELGIPILPGDHPIYSEGPTIMFVHHSPEQSVLKDANLTQENSTRASVK